MHFLGNQTENKQNQQQQQKLKSKSNSFSSLERENLEEKLGEFKGLNDNGFGNGGNFNSNMKIPWRLEVAKALITHSRRFPDRWITWLLAMKKGLRSRSKPWVTPIHASMKLAGLNFRAFDLLNVDQIAIEKCVCWASLFSIRVRERKREKREKCLKAKKMKENVNTETSGFCFFLFVFVF